MRFEMVIDLSFDVLDAAVNECLPGHAGRGWVEFERQELTSGSVRYDMYLTEHGDLGDLGAVIVRKIGASKSVLDVRDPERPRPQRPSQDEIDDIAGFVESRDERISEQLELIRAHRKAADELYKRRRDHQRDVITALFNRLSSDVSSEAAFSDKSPPEDIEADPVEQARAELEQFCSLFERQFATVLMEDGSPKENVARMALQAFLPRRGYQEVPVKRGRSDLLIHTGQGRLLYETKIWRGPQSFTTGLGEIEEYISGENDDGALSAAFYVVFDPTKSRQATNYLGSKNEVREIAGVSVHIWIVDLLLDIPSKHASGPGT